MKILFLTNIPSPYRVDFFSELGKMCELTVLFERNDAEDRNSKWLNKKNEYFNSVFLNGNKIGSDSAICFKVLNYLNKKKFDVIIVGGYSTPTGMLAINYLKFKKIPFILNVDGGFINKNENIIKKYIKKYFISSANYWLSSGKNTNEYLKYYGATQERIFTYPLTSISENDILRNLVDNDDKMMIRKSLNITEEKVILTVGQFIHRKGFDILLESCTKIPLKYGVYIVGGEPTQEYIELKNELALKNNIHFVGFKSKDELKQYYLASDLFVLPTREDIWGLVINEAMAYGLPIVTTDKCVAGLELVKDNENGFIVPIENAEILLNKIKLILNNEKIKQDMSKESLKIIKNYTVENMVNVHIEVFNKIKGDCV